MGLIRGVALEEGLLAVAGFGEVFEGEVAVIEVLGDEAGEVDFGEEGDLELDVAGVGVEEVAGGGDAGVDDGEGFGGAAHVVEELGAFLGDVDLELAAGEGAGFGGGEAAEAGGGAEEEFVGVVEAVVGPGGGGEFGFADDEGAVGAGAEVLWEVGLAGEGFPAIEGFLGVAEHACAIEGFAGGVGAEEIGEGAEGGTAFGHGGEVVLLDGGHEGDGIANGLKAGGGFAGAGEDFAEFAFEVGEDEGGGRGCVGGLEGFEEGETAAVGRDGLDGVAEIGGVGVALEVAEAAVAFSDFGEEGGIAAGVVGEAVVVFEGLGDEGTLGLGAAGEVADDVVEVEQGEAGEAADLFEAAFGGGAFGLGDAGLPECGAETGEEGKDGEGGGGDAGAMAADEAVEAVEGGVGTGGDGLAGEVAFEIVVELLDGRVAEGGVLFEGFGGDGVEIAFKIALPGEGGGLGRGRRFFLADGAEPFGGGVLGGGVGAALGEEFEEDDAEGVDIGAGGDGVGGDLFGAGVAGGEEDLGGGGLGRGEGVVEKFGDAEVEEFGFAALVDEDIGGFEVAMDDEVGVGEGDGGAELAEQEEALPEEEVVLVAELVEGDAVDELHGEIGLAVGGDAAIEEAGDGRVFEAGKDLAFAEEAEAGGFGVEGAEEEFDGGFLLEAAFVAGGEEDFAHAAGADAGFEAPGADACASGDRGLGLRLGLGPVGGERGEGGGLVEALGGVVGLEELGEEGAELGVSGAGLIEERAALVLGELESLVEEGFGLLPEGVVHDAGDGESRASWSQERAKVQSRSTVARATPRMEAISCSV